MYKQGSTYGIFPYGVTSVPDVKIMTGKHGSLNKVFVGQRDSNNHKHGIGIMVYSNGTYEEGFYKEGYLYGKGRKIRKNGECFHLKYGPTVKGANKHGYYWAKA